MEILHKKGFATVCSSNTETADSWYIPHHGVYHPNKPDKIRVVYDCSAQYLGRNLNKEVLSKPDLINQIVGVLCRFRENKVAFIADTEQMFYQVMVTEKHRCYLKFSWWKDGN